MTMFTPSAYIWLTKIVTLLMMVGFGPEITHAAQFKFTPILKNKCSSLFLGHSSMKQQVNGMGVAGNFSELSRNKFLFAPNHEVVAKRGAVVTAADMSKEASMYSATPEFAAENGGPIIKEIISKIPDWYYAKAQELGLYPNIDVRVHDLDLTHIPRGFDLYPAIPGWHADGEFRETYFSQPDLNKVPVSFHIISTISTDSRGVSNTQFLESPFKMTVDEVLPDSALWTHVHKYTESLNERETVSMTDGDIVMFDARSLHRAMPAKRSGLRLFFRMSMWHKPNLGEGQVSKQEQLYLLPRPGYGKGLDISREVFSEPTVVGSHKSTEEIASLAEEQSVHGASLAYMLENGGSVSKNLVSKIPTSFLKSATRKGLRPVFDMQIYRLYPGYRPYFPDHNGQPKQVNWHRSNEEAQEELWMSVSSSELGVSRTQFGQKVLEDGEILQTLSTTPRKELPTTNRGWRLMLRVRLVPESDNIQAQLIRQQYIDPGAENAGW